MSIDRPGASAQYELSSAQVRNSTRMNVNCGCAATKLSLLSLRVEMWASHETISRKPATFRKLNDLSS